MQFEFLLNEADGPILRLQRSIWTGQTKLYADDQEVPMQPNKGYFHSLRAYMVPMPDGSERHLTLQNRFYDPVPEVYVNDKPILLAKALHTWEYAIASLPVLLIFAGGLLGGLCGLAATFANLRIMRSERPAGLRIAFCVALTLAALIVYVLLAGMFQLAIES